MSKVKRSQDCPEYHLDKAERLKSLVKENPDFYSNVQSRDYRWMIIKSLLKTMDNDTSFDFLMKAHYLSSIEKDYILFHLNQVEQIMQMSYTDFRTAVEKFQQEIKDSTCSKLS